MILAKIFHHFPSNPWIFAAGVGSRRLVFGALRTDGDALPTGRGRLQTATEIAVTAGTDQMVTWRNPDMEMIWRF